MAAMFSGPVNAAEVGSYFVSQYYQMIQLQPHQAFHFYTDASTVVRIDGATAETATSTMQIHSLLTTLNFAGIEIKTIHSLDSWERGIIVMVSGLVQMKDYNCRRKFVQTFFLAPQERGYFVLNDMFHLLDEETVPQLSPTSLAHSIYEGNSNLGNNHIPEPVSGYMVEEEFQNGDYVAPANVLEEELEAREYLPPIHAHENDAVNNYSIPEPQQQVSEDDDNVDEVPANESVTSFPNVITVVQDPPAPSEEPVRERPKQTYASILRLAKEQPSNFVPRPATMSKPAPMSSDAQLATPASFNRPEKFTSEPVEDFSTAEDEGEVKSVYVGNLSSSVSADDLAQEFKNFGRIKPDGVTVRSRKDSGGFYAFVEFEDAASVQNALQASPLLINGRQIYVEERKPNSGISRFGGGRRGRGRGGFQSEALRGRVGGRGFTRSWGSDSNDDQDFTSSRPRGNGILQRGVPRQERGILGSHANMRNNGHNSYEASY